MEKLQEINNKAALSASGALSKLIDMKRFDEGKAIDIARKIMRDNAIRVHNLN